MRARALLFGLLRLRPALWLLLALATTVLGAAYVFQYGFGYTPCPLCLYQRLPWWLSLGLSAVALAVSGRCRSGAAWGLALIGGVLTIGAALAIWHAGIEWALWPGPTACSGGSGATDVETLRRAILSASVTRCDEAPWALFGLSMAGYNALASVAGVALAWGAALTVRQRAAQERTQ